MNKRKDGGVTMTQHTIRTEGGYVAGWLIRVTSSRRELGYVWPVAGGWKWRGADGTLHREGDADSQGSALDCLWLSDNAVSQMTRRLPYDTDAGFARLRERADAAAERAGLRARLFGDLDDLSTHKLAPQKPVEAIRLGPATSVGEPVETQSKAKAAKPAPERIAQKPMRVTTKKVVWDDAERVDLTTAVSHALGKAKQ